MIHMKTDYLIIGQGLAGTLVTWFLQQAGQNVLVIDDPRPQAASRVAAGLINPITGRYYVKSWRFDELLPFARATYAQLEAELDISLNEERPILRSLLTPADENSWWARADDPDYRKYLVKTPDLSNYHGKIHEAHAYGEVRQSGRAAVGRLVDAFSRKLDREGLLLHRAIRHEDFDQQDGHWRFGDIQARAVIFCEGYWGKFNPFFSYLPFRGAKGEIFRVRIPGMAFKKILKNRIFVVPLERDLYWVGATMENQFANEQPTEKGKAWLLDQLQQLLNTPFQVEEHLAGIRPTVKDRRPFLGTHPLLPGLAIFNGLGSKGTSLGPFFAKQLVDHLVSGNELDPEVDIRRFPIKSKSGPTET